MLRERIKRNDDERLPRLLDCRKWKTTARPQKTLRQPETTTGPRKTRARRRKRPRNTRGRATARPQKLRRGPAAPAAHARAGGPDPESPRPTRGQEGLTQKARKCSARNICPSLDSRSKTDLETQRTEKKLSQHAPTQRKARAREESSPGPPASKTDARPPGHQPRGGAPARPRFSRAQELDLESAQV